MSAQPAGAGAVQLPSSRSRSAAADPAVAVEVTSSGSSPSGSARASQASSSAPTSGWSMSLRPWVLAQQGLLHSTRSGGGQRHYTAAEIARVEIIRQLLDAGLGSKVIARLLPCVDSGGADVAEEAFSTMVRERGRLTADITRLAEARDALTTLIEANTRYRLGAGSGGSDPA